MARMFAIGMQTFSDMRDRGAIYVDKTALIYQLVTEGKVYFLSRPRRFGKSLLISTLEAYFSGQKELFTGLAMEKLEKEWTKYPVFRFDLSGSKYTDLEILQESLDFLLSKYENIYGRAPNAEKPSTRLKWLIESAHAQTGKQVVVLVDEYDAPLLDTLVDNTTFAKMRTMMRDFYSPLKSEDAHLKFVLLTGITKFSQLSIFSELNNLKNISLKDEYATICGITKEELLTELSPELSAFAKKNNMSTEEAAISLKQMYDGYHFSQNSPDIYNPFSLLNALQDKKLGYYWFSTGTPTYLTEILSKYEALKPEDLEGFPATEDMFNVSTEQAETPIPALYQSGYLTIKAARGPRYTLGFPNEEVRIGFLKGLMPYYSKKKRDENTMFISDLTLAFEEKRIDDGLNLLRSFLASIPYDAEKQDENHYKTMFYLIFRLASYFNVRTEERTANGRIDALLETPDTIYLFEFKLHDTAENALKQIDDKGYMIPYEAGHKQLVKIGVSFDDEKRTIKEWVTR